MGLRVHKCLPLLFAQSFTAWRKHDLQDVDRRLVGKAHELQEFEDQVRVAKDIGPDSVLSRVAIKWCQHARSRRDRWKLHMITRVYHYG